MDADRQWRVLEQHLSDLADRYAPPDAREGFCFHATELFSGGATFPRDRFPKEHRWRALDALCAIPWQFGLPVVMGHMPRADFAANNPGLSASDVLAVALAHCAAFCTIGVDLHLRQACPPDEVAAMVYENNDVSRRTIRDMHNLFRSPQKSAAFEGEIARYLPITRVVDTAHFAEKSDTSLLQIADACAFSIARKLKGASDADRFYSPLANRLVLKPRSLYEPGERVRPF